MKIALVSEHASPLAIIGSVDAGGQNVHVAELAKGLAALGANHAESRADVGIPPGLLDDVLQLVGRQHHRPRTR